MTEPESAQMAMSFWSENTLSAQSLIYFCIAGGALVLGLSLLYARYVRRDPRAVGSGGGFAFFAGFMFLFAIGAAAAGVVSTSVGR